MAMFLKELRWFGRPSFLRLMSGFALAVLACGTAEAQKQVVPAPKGCEVNGPAACEPAVHSSEEDIQKRGRDLMLKEVELFSRIDKAGLGCRSSETLLRAEGRHDLANRIAEKCNQ
jgi:hypothetical protein